MNVLNAQKLKCEKDTMKSENIMEDVKNKGRNWLIIATNLHKKVDDWKTISKDSKDYGKFDLDIQYNWWTATLETKNLSYFEFSPRRFKYYKISS